VEEALDPAGELLWVVNVGEMAGAGHLLELGSDDAAGDALG
jgi:hypothetical protein